MERKRRWRRKEKRRFDEYKGKDRNDKRKQKKWKGETNRTGRRKDGKVDEWEKNKQK